MSLPVVFQTPRFLLRQFTLEDAPLIFELNQNPNILRYIHERAPVSLEDAERIIETIILPQYQHQLGRWAIIDKNTGVFHGWCGLKYRPELNETDLGYRLFEHSWGSGIATETSLYSLRYGFEILKLQRITGRAHIDNSASIHVLKKCGGIQTGSHEIDDTPVHVFEFDATRIVSDAPNRQWLLPNFC